MAQLIKPLNFLDFYEKEIASRLSMLDVALKQTDDYISDEEAALLLGVSTEEIKSALGSLNKKNINSSTIVPVMLKLDSFICRLLKREMEYGCPKFYSPDAVSYIYGIELSMVKNAFSFLGLNMVSEKQLPAIFAQIVDFKI